MRAQGDNGCDNTGRIPTLQCLIAIATQQINDSLSLPLHSHGCICLQANYRLLLRIVLVLGTAKLRALEEADPAGRESVT